MLVLGDDFQTSVEFRVNLLHDFNLLLGGGELLVHMHTGHLFGVQPGVDDGLANIAVALDGAVLQSADVTIGGVPTDDVFPLDSLDLRSSSLTGLGVDFHSHRRGIHGLPLFDLLEELNGGHLLGGSGTDVHVLDRELKGFGAGHHFYSPLLFLLNYGFIISCFENL